MYQRAVCFLYFFMFKHSIYVLKRVCFFGWQKVSIKKTHHKSHIKIHIIWEVDLIQYVLLWWRGRDCVSECKKKNIRRTRELCWKKAFIYVILFVVSIGKKSTKRLEISLNWIFEVKLLGRHYFYLFILCASSNLLLM